MKIYARSSRSLTFDNLVGKDIWVLAQIGPSLFYMKVLEVTDIDVIYDYLHFQLIKRCISNSIGSSSSRDILRCHLDSGEYRYRVRKENVRLMDEILTTDELYEIAEEGDKS